MKLSLLLVSLISISILSCKKDSTPDPVPPAADKYMNYNAGSTWNYQKISNPSSASPTTTNYILTSSSRDTIISSRQYHVYTPNNGGANEYYYNTGSDYYVYRKLPADFGDSYVEIIYLKDNGAKGSSWEQSYPITYSGFPLTIKLTNTIVDRGLTKTINGLEYKDVIQVSTNFTATGIPFPYTITNTINYYYAPKYGSIQEETKIKFTITGFPASEFEENKSLQSADLK